MENKNVLTNDNETKLKKTSQKNLFDLSNMGKLAINLYKASFKAWTCNWFLKLLLFVFTLPFTILATVCLITYYILYFGYKILMSFADYLKPIIDFNSDYHIALKCVIAFFGFPIILSIYIYSIILLLPLYIIYFLLNINCFMISIGKIKIQPFLFNSKNEFITNKTKNKVIAIIILIIVILLLICSIIFFNYNNVTKIDVYKNCAENYTLELDKDCYLIIDFHDAGSYHINVQCINSKIILLNNKNNEIKTEFINKYYTNMNISEPTKLKIHIEKQTDRKVYLETEIYNTNSFYL